MTKLMMTTSGTRGVVGENLDPILTCKIAMAFGTFSVSDKPIIVGGDTRTSHDMYKRSVIAGLQSVGRNVIDIGMVPTPTVQQMIRKHSAAGGVVVTASHNPIIWNGIKLMNETGSFLDDAQHNTFLDILDNQKFDLKPWNLIGTVTEDNYAIDDHIDLILSKIDTSVLKGSGLNVLVDVNHGAGALADPPLFKKLGINVTYLYGEPDGKFSHPPEPNKANLSGLIEEMKTCNYDIGFSQDPDADRLVIVGNTGEFIGEDVSLAFCIDYILEKENKDGQDVVVNLSTSNIIEWVAKKHGATTHYSKIGETNVTQKIKELGAIVGGEGNGGVMYPKIGWGRDSLTGIVVALCRLAETKKTVEEIVSDYPKYHMLREKIQVKSRDQIQSVLDKLKSKYSEEKVCTQDGVKVYLERGWIQVRASNTEPIVRIFIEANTKQQAENWFADVSLAIS
ncbi:phosphoglucosamine mutase [bacterium]|jgi:phosphomannomutase|nr:phosphoglucosamine mutase [bacterium]